MKLTTITRESFAPFGSVVEFSPHPENDEFEIVVREPDMPWRIAMLRVIRREASKLERHPDSLETFEPISGFGVLLCSAKDDHSDLTAFVLDKPVCVGKGIWHEVFTLSDEAFYKLTENCDVPCEYHYLDNAVGIEVGENR